jgi:hypothetical protein
MGLRLPGEFLTEDHLSLLTKVRLSPRRRGFTFVQPCLASAVKQRHLPNIYLFVGRINVNLQSPARVAGHIKKRRRQQVTTLIKTAIAMAMPQLAPGSGARAQISLASHKYENVVIVIPSWTIASA